MILCWGCGRQGQMSQRLVGLSLAQGRYTFVSVVVYNSYFRVARHTPTKGLDFGPGHMARSWSAALCLSRSSCATRDYPSLGTIWQLSPYLRLTLSGRTYEFHQEPREARRLTVRTSVNRGHLRPPLRSQQADSGWKCRGDCPPQRCLRDTVSSRHCGAPYRRSPICLCCLGSI